ncbi:MAG: hypothetical protein ACRDH2_09250, partial [Anaerolineales bacterium]
DRFMTLSAGDILAGLEHPRMITSVEGYVEPDGQALHFDSIDAFNTYQADKHAAWDWARIQAMAIDAATTLHVLFTHPQLLSAGRLEKTRRYRKRLTNGVVLNDIAMGWNLWLTVLDHAAVEHAAELGMDK